MPSISFSMSDFPPRARSIGSSRSTNIWPPPISPDETDAEREERLEKEKEDRKKSEAIDHAIDLERTEMRKQKPDTKILLLGQAESGKSTILKNFQLVFAPQSFYAEAEAWRAVIHLNLVRSVNFVLDMLEDPNPTRSQSAGGYPRSPPPTNSNDHLRMSNELRYLKMRLVPLRSVEQMLTRRFTPWDIPTGDASTKPRYQQDRASEVSVRGLSGWKSLLKNRRQPNSSAVSDDLEDSQRVIEACKDDMTALWEDPVVREGLKKRNIQLQDQSGFFLSDVSRIAAKDYTPTSDDIMRARLQTIGVEEHRIVMETDAERGKEWMIYDVSGSRGHRAVWAPFIDDVDVVIFLAPISVFNQSLAEDKSVNRLLDSFELWKQICSNQLLCSAHLIIMLNKCDILDAKLQAGMDFSRFVTSYKGKNDFEHVSKYLKAKFVSLHQQLTPQLPRPRRLYTHMTCATDTRATSVVLSRIRDVILTNALSSSDIL